MSLTKEDDDRDRVQDRPDWSQLRGIGSLALVRAGGSGMSCQGDRQLGRRHPGFGRQRPDGHQGPLVEDYIKKEKQHQAPAVVLNKVDLVPMWVTQKWVSTLSQEYPTIAFRASCNSFARVRLSMCLDK